jgi:hypothetical protein
VEGAVLETPVYQEGLLQSDERILSLEHFGQTLDLGSGLGLGLRNLLVFLLHVLVLEVRGHLVGVLFVPAQTGHAYHVLVSIGEQLSLLVEVLVQHILRIAGPWVDSLFALRIAALLLSVRVVIIEHVLVLHLGRQEGVESLAIGRHVVDLVVAWTLENQLRTLHLHHLGLRIHIGMEVLQVLTHYSILVHVAVQTLASIRVIRVLHLFDNGLGVGGIILTGHLLDGGGLGWRSGLRLEVIGLGFLNGVGFGHVFRVGLDEAIGLGLLFPTIGVGELVEVEFGLRKEFVVLLLLGGV